MAIYHLCIKIISRGKGKSAVAASAYRSGEKIKNEYDGIVHDFTRKHIPKFYYRKMHLKNFQTVLSYGIAWRK